MQMQAVLKDDALVELLTFITTHKSDEAAIAPLAGAFAETVVNSIGDRSVAVKAWLAKHSAGEILNKIKWDTNPEKILLMGGFHESKVETDSWRSADMETRFAEAKETSPTNFPRDIATGIKSGFITTVTPRTYIVSRTGWNKIADAIAKLPPE
jgi:hypothetical protein